MKKTISPPISHEVLRQLTKLLWSQDGQPISRDLDFYRKIEEQFLTAKNSYRGGVSNLFALRTER
jgi:hypothetical protein